MRKPLLLIFALLVLNSCDFKPIISKPSVSPDGRSLLMGISHGSQSGIYQMRQNGTVLKQITFSSIDEGDREAVYSFDGTKIVFTRGDKNRNRHLYLMNADGTGETRLTQGDNVDSNPVFSRSGNVIYFSRLENSDRYAFMRFDRKDAIYSLEIKDRRLIKIKDINGEDGFNAISGFSITTDELYLLLVKREQSSQNDEVPCFNLISLKDLSNVRLIKPVLGQLRSTLIADPSFSKDGKAIIFAARFANDGVYLLDLQTEEVRKITDEGLDFVKWPSFTSDDKEILFCAGDPYSCGRLWKIDADGSNSREIRIDLAERF